MKLSGKAKKPGAKAASVLSDREKARTLVAAYARGSITLQCGRYSTEKDKQARKAKIAAMDL